MRPWRVGIRAKLLLLFGSAMAAVITLDSVVQIAAFRAFSEYEASLARYHAEHRVRVSLRDHFLGLERRLRENVPPGVSVDDVRSQLLRLWVEFDQVRGAASDSLEAYFDVRATLRAIEAYERYAVAAAQRRAAGDKDYYQSVAAAAKVAAYADAYLSDLLSESIDRGELRFQEASASSERLRFLSAAALALLMIVFAGVAAIFSSAIAGPIHRLAEASERIAAGDLEVDEVRASTGDEVEILARSFNAMARNLRAMVAGLLEKAELERKLREEERELMAAEAALRETRFANLQDQIRPHFLFNALNTIARTALFEEAQETERLTLALAKLFRYSLGNPETLVSVREEMEVVKEYLSFQSIRFGERLNWNLHCEKGAETALMPRFTLQPLVENAVRHGIEPMEAGGELDVSVRRRSGRIYMNVRDTGAGMDPAVAREILEGSGGGMGLSNVVRRIALRYGDSGKVSVSSTPGAGTTIRLSIPAEEGHG